MKTTIHSPSVRHRRPFTSPTCASFLWSQSSIDPSQAEVSRSIGSPRSCAPTMASTRTLMDSAYFFSTLPKWIVLRAPPGATNCTLRLPSSSVVTLAISRSPRGTRGPDAT